MKKTVIIPIVAAIALFVKLVFKIDLDENTQALIVDTVSAVAFLVVTLWGIWKDHKKAEPPEKK